MKKKVSQTVATYSTIQYAENNKAKGYVIPACKYG